ncbi:putative cytoplasmic trna adenylyltransferase [Monocercomonoides exilis]|uniref:putative cytoplasmic trna adenylyltransferase n=1 Tax=Monocercomonoides exilis TaxID=2049356 RepID=UPI00355A2D92|nr:putative cytoplasmic trna adenylyltransferase [Monocercomonoides exilis]
MKCARCGSPRFAVKRMRTGNPMCKECFMLSFEEEVHQTIIEEKLFEKGEIVAIGVSGGKDSTCLLHILTTLNQRYNYGLDIRLVAIDEGIYGYRDFSLECVKENSEKYSLPLVILSFKDLFGYTMDEINNIVGTKKSKCTHCGIFRRKALEIGCQQIGANKIALGHNADDYAETILMNLMRGDIHRLERSGDITTGKDFLSSELPKLLKLREANSKNEKADEKSSLSVEECAKDANEASEPNLLLTSSETKASSSMPPTFIVPTLKVKPFKYSYQREIVLYCHFKKLNFFSVECTYAQASFRGYARQFLVKLQESYPMVIGNIIHSSSMMHVSSSTPSQKMQFCRNCGFISSQQKCQACVLIDELKSEEKRKETTCEVSEKDASEELTACSEKKGLAVQKDMEDIV